MGTVRHACERARVLISLELDVELAEVESSLLERHLGACQTCVEYREQIRAFTDELRAAPQVDYRSNLAPVRRLPRRVPVRRIVHLSAAAVAMLTVGGTVGHSLADRDPPATTPGPVVTVVSVRNEPGIGSQAPLVSGPRPLPIGQRNAAADF